MDPQEESFSVPPESWFLLALDSEFFQTFDLNIESLLYTFKKVAHAKVHEIYSVVCIADFSRATFYLGDILVQSWRLEYFGSHGKSQTFQDFSRFFRLSIENQ